LRPTLRPTKICHRWKTSIPAAPGKVCRNSVMTCFGIPGTETQAKLDALAQNNPEMPMGAVQDDFILHAGDELDITFTGQRTDRGFYKVNSQGLIVIPDLPPIPAEGRAIAQVRLSIKTAAQNLHNTDAYVSLSSVRQIGVLVVGHVKRPGRQTLTVFHTVIDALMGAGGIDKTGSLRQVKLVRGGAGKSIDLYTLLMNGTAGDDLRLAMATVLSFRPSARPLPSRAK
jgi:protein involved in polysaccharide export with SLBB domain